MEYIGEKTFKVYKFGDYFVEVAHSDGEWNAWLYREGYGTRLYLFGAVENEVLSEGAFIEMISGNIADYLKEYHDNYED